MEMMFMSDSDRTIGHFSGFSSVWHGGYYEGDPLDPLGSSKYRRLGYISILHAVYQVCVKPYIKKNTVALEIGPGRGAWTKGMLDAKEVWCLDAKSKADNKIDEYLGNPSNLIYHLVTDYSCSMLPDDKFDYVFSFGCLCHVPWEGVCEYAENLFPKMKSGCTAIWMVADYEKRNKVANNFSTYDIYARTLPPFAKRMMEFWNRHTKLRHMGPDHEVPLDKDNDNQKEVAGRWYHSGAGRTAAMLRELGYEIVSEDLGLLPRDALVHFRKP